ncbi:MAG: sugar phosphate isomerase/epimerase [Candidatus Brocadiia bacterium]
MALKIGLIGIIGDELKKDPWGTLEQVAEIGYDGIEGAAGIAGRVGLSVPEMKERLDELGLEAVAQGGVRLESDDEQIKQAISNARDIGCKYVVQYWGPVESREQLLEEAEFFDRVGEMCAEAGLKFCYHNHNHEFATFDGEYAMDILLANTNPDNVMAELDIAWVTYGGADPGQMIRKHAGRCPILHVKDVLEVPGGGVASNDGRQETKFTEVGTGVVDLEGAVEAARESGVEWLSIEQDRMRNLSPMDSIRVSYNNLRRVVG